ncbi:MAG: SPOR domain-containing protein, partial [Treponema sp.]|nr:SPOR domain-containing protein [Treponema sp.]
PLPEEGDALVFVEAGGVPAEEGATEDDAPSPLPEEGDAPVFAEAGGVPADAEAPVIYSDDYNLALVPAEDRAPVGEKGVVIPLDEQIPPIAIHQEQEQPLDPASFIASIEDALTLSAGSQSQDVASARSSANFSVPMITSMEKGKYYVQLRSYSRPELVESELVKIGKQRNLAVQMTELSGRQLYRILIGPVSHDESSQLLRQYKAKGWGDAFVWLGK